MINFIEKSIDLKKKKNFKSYISGFNSNQYNEYIYHYRKNPKIYMSAL